MTNLLHPPCNAASYDWSSSQLGDLAHWPLTLRVAADVLLNLTQPALLVWGKETITIFNEAYADLAGPALSRVPGGTVPPILPPPLAAAGQALQQAWQGLPQSLPNQRLTYRAASGVHEHLCDLRLTPLVGDHGAVAGIVLVLDPPQYQTQATDLAANASSALRILVVEDNPDALYLVCEMLRAFGHDAHGVVHPDDAVAHLSHTTVDVLFSDVSLPGMSGVELARRSLASYPGLQVIFASGYGDSLLQGLEFPYLSLQKPYELDQLQAALNSLRPRQLA